MGRKIDWRFMAFCIGAMCAFAVVILLIIDRDYYFNSLITVYLATATLVLWLIALPDYLMKDWGLGMAAWLHKRPSDDTKEEPEP